MTSNDNEAMELKPGQHRIDNIADHAASMLVFDEEDENSWAEGNANTTQNKVDEAYTKRAITRKKLQALSVHDDFEAHRAHKSICSPSNNSMCSQSTALSRARSEIEGRRKSRAAARARIDAVLDEIQSPKSNRDAANERAWAALAEVQKSRSMKSSSHEEEERRQPGPSVDISSDQLEEARDENDENRVGQVISFGKSDVRKSRTNKSKVTADTKKASIKSPKEKTSKDRKKRNSVLDESKHESAAQNDQNPPFGLSEEALLAVSQAAFEKVAPVMENLESLEKDEDDGDKYEVAAAVNRGEMHSLASSNNSASKNTGQSSATSSFTLSEADVFAVSQAALDVSAKMGSFETIQEEPTIESTDDEINEPGDKYEVENMNVLELDGDASRRDALLAVSQAALNSAKIDPLKTDQKDAQKEEHQDDDALNDMKSPPFVRTISEASTQPYTKTTQQIIDVKERKEFAQEPTPRTSNNSSPIPSQKPSLSSNHPNDSGHPKPPAASKTQDASTHKSEGVSNMSLSSASSSWTNEYVEKNVSEVDKEMGALDSMMFQKKGVGLGDNTKSPEIETGLTNNSDESGNSSYSSEHSHDLSPNKSMGPIWQKALDDAKALSPKSEKQNKGLVHADDETVADDDTLLTARPGFSRERLQYTGKFNFCELFHEVKHTILIHTAFLSQLVLELFFY